MNRIARLIQIEWLKNASYKPVVVFLIIYFSLLVFFGLICNQSIPFFGIAIDLKDLGLLEFPLIWNFLFYIAATLKIFLGMIIMITVSNEMSSKLFKQNIIDGLSRDEYIISKIVSICALSMLSTVVIILMGLYFGFNNASEVNTSHSFNEIYFAFGYFLKLVCFMFLFFLLTIIFKKGILVILSIIVLWVLEVIIRIIEFKFFTNTSNEDYFLFSDYLPLFNMSNLIDSPFERIKIAELITGKQYVFIVPYDHIFVAILYMVIFIGLARFLIYKRDL